MQTISKLACGAYWGVLSEKKNGTGESQITSNSHKPREFFTIELQHLDCGLTFHSYQAAILISLSKASGRAVKVKEMIEVLDLTISSRLVSQEVPKIIAEFEKVPGVNYEPLGAKYESKSEVRLESKLVGKVSSALQKDNRFGRWRIPTKNGEFVFECGWGKMQVYCADVNLIQLAQPLLARAFRETLLEADDELLAKALRQLKIQQVHSLILSVIQAGDAACDFDASSVRCVLDHRNIATGAELRSIWEDCRVLHQLPASPSSLVGRDEDLHHLRQQRAVKGTLYVALRGMPGIGKTTLACALAYEWKPRFPDAQLVLDGRGGTASPPSAARLLATAVFALRPELRLLYDEDTIENSRSEFEGLYQDILAGKKALIWVDNALDADQVKALMPPAGSALLVASRARFVLHGTPPYLVGRLSDEKAEDLLRVSYPRLEKADAHALVRLCDALPLALCIVGSHLALEASEQGGKVDVTAYITKLQSARLATLDTDASQTDQAGISATLHVSEQSLSEIERDAWHRLSLFPADWDAEAAAAVTEVSADVCESLFRRSLLERIGERYRFHDLVREFALSRLRENPSQYQEAKQRHAQHYSSVLQETSLLHAKGGSSTLSGLELFDKEWINIEAGQKWAHDNVRSDPRAARLCVDYPNFGVNALDLRQHPRTQIHWLEAALCGMKCLNQSERTDKERKSLTLHNLGLAYSNLGEMPQAIRCFEQSLSFMIALENKLHEAICRGNCGWAYHQSGQIERAFELYHQGLETAGQITDMKKRDRAKTTLLGNKGIAHKNQAEYAQALECYNEAIETARTNDDRWSEGKMLGNIGVVYDLTHDYLRAIEQYEKQLVIAKAMDDKRGQAAALFNKSISISNLGDIKQATALGELALELYGSISDPMVAEVEETLAAWRLESLQTETRITGSDPVHFIPS